LNGAMIALLMLLLIFLDDIVFGAFVIAVLSFLSIILIPPFLTRIIWEELLNVRPSLTHLIPVSFLTFIIPLFGASFGGPSLSDLSYWLMLPLLAAVGGALWSLPFAGWEYNKSRRNPQ